MNVYQEVRGRAPAQYRTRREAVVLVRVMRPAELNGRRVAHYRRGCNCTVSADERNATPFDPVETLLNKDVFTWPVLIMRLPELNRRKLVYYRESGNYPPEVKERDITPCPAL